MMKRFQFHEEQLLIGVAFFLLTLLVALTVWGVTSLAAKFTTAVDARQTEVPPPPVFELEQAEAILRSRGLLQ